MKKVKNKKWKRKWKCVYN